MDYLIQSVAIGVVARRLHDFRDDATEEEYREDSDAETADLFILAGQSAIALIDLRAKCEALRATPFVTNGFVDAPAPGELELLRSLLTDLHAI